MFKYAVCFLLLLVPHLIRCAVLEKRKYYDKPKNKSKIIDFEILVLAQGWPQTTYWSLNHKRQNVNCHSYKSSGNSWTLHGLWPSNRHGGHPSHCTNEIRYNENSLGNELKAEMHVKWPTYKMKMRNEQFWSYEWNKHGTCALTIHNTNTLMKYFTTSVGLLNKYNAGKILGSSNILPGGKYKLIEIVDTIRNKLGVRALVDCARNKETEQQYLLEIRLCFDKSFNLVDCRDSDANISNCRRSQLISYPEHLKLC